MTRPWSEIVHKQVIREQVIREQVIREALEARIAALEADLAAERAHTSLLAAALTLASGLEDYSSHNHGCGVLKAWSVRMTAGEYACTCGLSDAYRTIRAALAATPADSRKRWQAMEAVPAARRMTPTDGGGATVARTTPTPGGSCGKRGKGRAMGEPIMMPADLERIKQSNGVTRADVAALLAHIEALEGIVTGGMGPEPIDPPVNDILDVTGEYRDVPRITRHDLTERIRQLEAERAEKAERIEELTLHLEDSAARLADVAAIAREAGDKAYLYGTRAEAAEADVAFMRNTGQAVWQSLQAAEARVAALEFDLAAERAHAARLAAALTPFTDVLTKCFHLLPVYPDDQPLFTWRHVGGFEKFFYAGAARAIAAALAATPADSLDRLQRLEAVAEAARALEEAEIGPAPVGMAGQVRDTGSEWRALTEALARLDGKGLTNA